MEFFEHSVFFGVSLSLLAYGLGVVLQKRFRLALFNPLLLSVIVTILVLVTAHIDYEVYYAGGEVPQLPAHAGDRVPRRPAL